MDQKSSLNEKGPVELNHSLTYKEDLNENNKIRSPKVIHNSKKISVTKKLELSGRRRKYRPIQPSRVKPEFIATDTNLINTCEDADPRPKAPVTSDDMNQNRQLDDTQINMKNFESSREESKK